ncbi:MAG: hypothetical protein K2Q27_07750 [Novosphingobium sp.]|nr:hypothetical protein [Novosphingobium sp.]
MRLWYVFVPFIALSSLNAGYSAWRASPPSKLTEFRAMCFGKVEAAGLSRSESIPLCNCLIGKARWYKWTHFGADYTRDVHMKLSRECIDQVAAASAESASGWGTFTSEPARSSRPLTGPGSGWGEAPNDDDSADSADRSYSSPPTKQYGDPGYGTE